MQLKEVRQPKSQGETVPQSTKKGGFIAQNCLSKRACFQEKGTGIACDKNRLLTQFGSYMETSSGLTLKFKFNKHHHKLITMHKNMTDQVRP